MFILYTDFYLWKSNLE